MKKEILSALKKHLKTKSHHRPDFDYIIEWKKKKMYSFNNSWGASQQEGFEEAIAVIKKMTHIK